MVPPRLRNRLRRLPIDPAERAARRAVRKERRRRRALAALPQGITLGSIFFGILALYWAPTRPYAACVCVILAGVCDMLDGRVARLTGTTSAFGAQLDSLADMVSFGVAPATIVFHWAFGGTTSEPIAGDGTAPFNPFLLLTFAFVAAGAVRLARFNARHDEDEGPAWFFEGIAIPSAAGLLVTLVMAHQETGLPLLRSPVVVVPLLLVTSALMVSQIPFPSFKNFRNKTMKYGFFGTIVGGLSLLALGGPGGSVLFLVLVMYIVLGLVNAVRDNLRPGASFLDDETGGTFHDEAPPAARAVGAGEPSEPA